MERHSLVISHRSRRREIVMTNIGNLLNFSVFIWISAFNTWFIWWKWIEIPDSEHVSMICFFLKYFIRDSTMAKLCLTLHWMLFFIYHSPWQCQWQRNNFMTENWSSFPEKDHRIFYNYIWRCLAVFIRILWQWKKLLICNLLSVTIPNLFFSHAKVCLVWAHWKALGTAWKSLHSRTV